MNLCPPVCLCLVHPLCIVWWKPGCPCMSVCLCPSHLISVATPCLECVHAPVHAFMSTWLPMSAPPLCIVWRKPGCPCMAVCLCPSHLISGLMPCLECLHALVHVFMSTWLAISGSTPVHTFIEPWVPLCATVCVSKSPCLWSHNLFRVCTCISTCNYVYLTDQVWSRSYAVWWKPGCPWMAVSLCPSCLICSHT